MTSLEKTVFLYIILVWALYDLSLKFLFISLNLTLWLQLPSSPTVSIFKFGFINYLFSLKDISYHLLSIYYVQTSSPYFLQLFPEVGTIIPIWQA